STARARKKKVRLWGRRCTRFRRGGRSGTTLLVLYLHHEHSQLLLDTVLPLKAEDGTWQRAEPLVAVAQKSPCEEIRVIRGKASPLKLSRRELDAREEVPMRTPKRLYAEARIIYQPELLTCLHCGDLLVPWNYLAWDKTVQTLDGLLSIATRPGHCPQATCPGSRMRLLSAAAQRLAP